MKKQTVRLGTISHGTMREEDLIPAFSDELRRLRGALPMRLARDVAAWHSLCYGAARTNNTDSIDAAELVQDLADALNDYAPDYCYFGAHPGDGSDYGFWLDEGWQERAREDGVKFVADLSEVSDTFRGALCVVNDHGNATLYCTDEPVGTLREIWSVV